MNGVMVAAALLGGVGAVARMEVDALVNRLVAGLRCRYGGFPLGTVVVNATACLLIGAVTGFASAGLLSGEARYLLASGFLGGYSTFSTASVEGAKLLIAGHPWQATVHAGGMLVLSMAALAAGFALTGAF